MFIKGLDKLQRDLAQVSKVFAANEGRIATIDFDPLDSGSVEAAIAKMQQAIDELIAPYPGNSIVANIADQMKKKYEDKILDRSSLARAERANPEMNAEPLQQELQDFEHTIADLRASNYQTFERHIKKLSRILHSGDLTAFTVGLLKRVDLETFLQGAKPTQGMTGSARLNWPDDSLDEVGVVIALIDWFATDWNEALQFSHEYYTNGTNITANLRNMIGQMIVPFARDYVNFVKKQRGEYKSESESSSKAATFNQQFNFHNSSIGAVQTGNDAVANVSLDCGSQGIVELGRALDAVAKALAAAESVPGHNKEELLELVEDGKLELGKKKPNLTKLTSYMGIIGGALGAAANMKPAYETLKAAAALAGITLP